MERKYWFKAKEYGWGWYPCSLEGWYALIFYLAAETMLFLVLNKHRASIRDTLIIFIPITLVLTGILITLCWLKGEKPRWRWGN